MTISEAVARALKENKSITRSRLGSKSFQRIPATAVISFQQIKNSSREDVGIPQLTI